MQVQPFDHPAGLAVVERDTLETDVAGPHRQCRGAGHVVHGGRKAEAVAQIAADRGIDLARSWAYSDSCQDTPLLESVGHPVAVNADRHLRRTARARGWERLTSRTRADATRSHLLQVGTTLVACVGAAGLVTLVLTALPLR